MDAMNQLARLPKGKRGFVGLDTSTELSHAERNGSVNMHRGQHPLELEEQNCDLSVPDYSNCLLPRCHPVYRIISPFLLLPHGQEFASHHPVP